MLHGLQRLGCSTPPAPRAGREHCGCTPPSPLDLWVQVSDSCTSHPMLLDFSAPRIWMNSGWLKKKMWSTTFSQWGRELFTLKFNVHKSRAYFLKFLSFLAALQAMWGPSPQPEIEATLPTVEAWSPNPRTAREVLVNPVFKMMGHRGPLIASVLLLTWLGLPPATSPVNTATMSGLSRGWVLSILFIFLINTYQLPASTTYTLKSDSSILSTGIIQITGLFFFFFELWHCASFKRREMWVT